MRTLACVDILEDYLEMKKEEEKESEFLIKKREIGELFDSKFDLNINLFRGNNPNNRNSALYPILKAFLLSNGNVRKEDIRTYQKQGEPWVDSTSGGISLFDKIGIPVNSWEYFLIGKKIPYGLVITKDGWNQRFQATHYTIRPQWDMPVVKFCFLLDELATGLRGA